jgi:hypothetical protein
MSTPYRTFPGHALREGVFLMRARRRSAIEDLRTAIDCLPVDTRIAMLDGIRRHDIIVGAYTDRRGGVCPMLAAHRCGGRTNFLAFAHAWDRFTHARKARPATHREVATLVSHLQASLLADPATEFSTAIAEHQATSRERREREAARVGWSWLWTREREDASVDREHELV